MTEGGDHSEEDAKQSEASGVDDGLSGDVAKRACGGYGNAIVPQVAQVFIETYMNR